MTEEERKEILERVRHGQSLCPVGYTLRKKTEAALEQIEIGAFSERDDPLARVLAGIIAEVYILPPGCTVRIEGEALPVETVREVYAGITHEHVAGVISRFRETGHRIRHIKSYLRTALYNAVFEFDFDCENVAAIAATGGTECKEKS